MTENTREALEEAFKVINPEPYASAIFRHQRPRDDETHELDGLFPEWDKWNAIRLRFRRFLDAEAWTDAAMCLVPEGWGWNVSQPNAKAIASGLLKIQTPVRGEVENGFEQRFIVAGETPAHALLAACLKAKEQADGSI